MRRAYIGTILGVAVAVIWHWLGWETLLWCIGFGLIGFGVGWIADSPEGVIRLLRRLER